jgi:hypothetical protein
VTPHVRKVYGGRSWFNSSVHAIMDGVPADRDPKDVVCGLAQEMVARARALGWSGPPFDPVRLASIESIRVRPSDGPMESDALIRALADGSLEIVWNQDTPSTRRNFSICHELGHTLFPDAYEVVRHRSARRRNPDDELERLCDAAAAEILMPREEFVRDLADLDLDADAISTLARRYAASPEATARRIATLAERSCAAVLLTLRLKLTEERRGKQRTLPLGGRGTVGPHPKLRVDYTIPSSSFGLHFPEHKSIPDDSCVYEALRGGSTSAVETWSTGKTEVRLAVHALSIPADAEGRLRALALVVRPRAHG